MGEEIAEEEEEQTLEAISESVPSKSKKKGKDKKAFNPLSDNIKFKKIDFEHALTPEEKAAKKAEKEAKKKGNKGKPKREKVQPEQPISTAVTEEQEAQVEETETIVTQEETSLKVKKVKDKKGKKEKVKEKTKEGKKEKKVVETTKKVDGEEENEEEEIEEKVAIDEEKKGKKKQKAEKPEKVPKEKAKKEKKEKPKKGKKEKKKKQVISASSVTEEVEEAETKPKKEKKGKKGKGKGKKGKKAPIEEEVEEEEEEIIKPVEVPSDDEWSWYSCSCSEGEEEEKVEEEEEKIKKGKKGKKEKEKKKRKKTVVQEKEKVEEPVPEDDIFEEIRKMQAAAMGQLEDAEVAEEAPKPKKEKKKKPKKEKKPKKVQEVKMTEAMRKQMEEEAKRLAEEERLRAEEERRALIAKEKKEQLDHVLRMEQLANSVTLQKQISEHNLRLFLTVKDHAEWDHYIRCDGLPFALDIPKMNTYLDFWKKYIPKTDIKTTTQRTKDILKLLEFLEEYIEFPLDAGPKKIENWKWIRSQCREVQQRNMDSLGCYVLKNIRERMTRISVPMAVFSQSEDDFILCLNALVPLPTPMPNPRRPPPKRLDINLTQLNVRLLFPENVTCYLLAIRAMYLKYDHLTDTSSTFVEPELAEIYKKDLKETTFLEFYQKLYYKFINRVIPPPKQLEEGEEPPKEPEVDVEKGIVPTVPFQKLEPSASEYFFSMEDDVYGEALKSLQLKLAPDVINLRKYSVMGGLFFINLFCQPPQPKELPNLEIIITLVTNPECLVEYPFYVNYVPPPTSGPGVIRSPEEIEEEMKKQEQEMDKLVFVNMDLPTHVLWLDPPTVCRWNYAEKQWVNKDVHDVKYIEEKATISFRIGKFGTFGLAVNKHCNLPYQTWEIKPEKDGSISLQITAAILFIEFNVNGKLVCVSKLQNSPTSAMKEHIGVYYKLTKLIRILKQGGIDFFPGHDAFLYVEGGHCQKHWPTEKHLYYNIAEIAGVYNIAWSRWNIFAGRRNIIFQVRDYDVDKVKQVPFSLVLVNPLNAIYIDCTEISPALVLEPIEGMKFYSDLFYLIRATSRMSTRTKIQNTPLDVVGTLAELITATRIFSWA